MKLNEINTRWWIRKKCINTNVHILFSVEWGKNWTVLLAVFDYGYIVLSILLWVQYSCGYKIKFPREFVSFHCDLAREMSNMFERI